MSAAAQLKKALPVRQTVDFLAHAESDAILMRRSGRAMAFAALHADSSLAVRLTRYNAHMARARQLEAQEATQ